MDIKWDYRGEYRSSPDGVLQGVYSFQMDSGGGSMSQELTSQNLKVILSLFELDINASQAC